MMRHKRRNQHTDKFNWIAIEATLKSSHNMVQPFCVRMWNGKEDRTGKFIEPPVLDQGTYIHRNTDEYLTVDGISRKLNKVLRHQTGKAEVIGRSGRQHDIRPCNEGGWVNINDVLMYGHIFNDNSNRITREAERGNYLDEILDTRYRRCCQAMWYSKTMQNRVRLQIAAVRISISDVMKEEQRECWEENYRVPNDVRWYIENDRWLLPVAMRAVSSHNLESRHTDKNENDVVLDPRLTSHEIADTIAMQLGGSFHVTTLGKIPSTVKHGILPGGDKGFRGSSFFNHFAPWGTRSTTLLRSKIPTDDVPVALYVPIAYLQRLGARLAESSYVVMFKGVPWENVKGAWYREPVKGNWKSLLAKGVTKHLIAAATHSNKVAAKDQIIEKASARRDDNIRKLDDIVNDGDTKRTKQEPWNVIIARTCEGYSSVDGNILCPACMNVTSNIFTLCLHCHGRFHSCGARNTLSTSNVVEIDDDDEVEKGDDVETEHVNDPDKEEQEMIDKVKMDKVKSALQSQIVPDDEEEEISQEHIEES